MEKRSYSRFCKWRDTGLLVAIFQALQVEPDFENLSIDSTSVKAHQHSAGAKKRPRTRSESAHRRQSWRKDNQTSHRCRWIRKPLAFLLTGGQVYDSVPAIDLLQKLDITGSHILGDKAYGSEVLN
ncbi:transposase [Paenibacillus sp. FSL L8-0340]|uniref:transposase n=1 Tax=Paenibacillus sp. FSL L8-0340 TaxID=2954685 RepID=UPI003158BF2B